jgi:hypothetical protein
VAFRMKLLRARLPLSPHTLASVSSYAYICVRSYIFFWIFFFACTSVFARTTAVYVSACCCVCLCVCCVCLCVCVYSSSCCARAEYFFRCYICVLILLRMCPHTAAYVSSCCCVCVFILLHMCPLSTAYVSAYCCVCVLMLLRMCPHTAAYLVCVCVYLVCVYACVLVCTHTFHKARKNLRTNSRARVDGSIPPSPKKKKHRTSSSSKINELMN